jgi:uncharacterized protein
LALGAQDLALIIDTGPLFALLDSSDRQHRACRALIEGTSEVRVIPSPVLVELDQLVSSRGPASGFIALLSDLIDGAYHVADLERDDYGRVRELCEQYEDADIGFVDASVVAIGERLGEKKIATLDRRHFSIIRPKHVAAFELLPE